LEIWIERDDMLKRYLITLGAPTTAGGKVSTARSFKAVNSVKVALEGDKVWCPQCNSEGVIEPDGPRLTDLFYGKQVALHDDLCICKCSPPPRLVATQTVVCQTVSAGRHASHSDETVPDPARSDPALLIPAGLR
jgi:uncharacterized Zn-binding protein involved in type VI secretion